MKRWKKITLVLLSVILLSQLPFAWRRYKLGRLQSAIAQLNSTRVVNSNPSDWAEYKGVMHVHSFLGGHSTGTFADIIAGATANQLNFVMMTEHPSPNFDTAAMTLTGMHAGILFVNGNEVATANHDRLLILPGDETAAAAGGMTTPELLSQAKVRLAVVAYPAEFKSWDTNGYDGVEVYNLFTNSRRINPVITFFDGLWSWRSYPDLLFATFYDRPVADLKLWDAQLANGRRLVATAGNDAHANVGLSLNDSTGKTLLGIKVDSYERSFRLFRMHVLLPPGQALDTTSLLRALHDGHAFIGFDLFGDTTGFRFSASNGKEQKIQGDVISLGEGVRLTASTPVSSRIVLIRDGRPTSEQSGAATANFAVTEKGAYRIEVYLSQLPPPVNSLPWVISNPIYVR